LDSSLGFFIDHRDFSQTQQLSSAITTEQSSSPFLRIMLGLGFLLVAELVFLIYKNKLKRQMREAGLKESVTFPEILISYNESFHDSSSSVQVERTSEVRAAVGSAAEMMREVSDDV
jgi:hypothetical protein